MEEAGVSEMEEAGVEESAAWSKGGAAVEESAAWSKGGAAGPDDSLEESAIEESAVDPAI